MSYLPISARDVEALVKAVRLGEETKPSQQAKRDVFREYGILGTEKDRVLTAIYYDIWRRMGVVDRIASEIIGVKDVAILDPWLRAGVRVAIELLIFERFVRDSRYRDFRDIIIKYLKGRVAKLLSNETHPYVGAYFWNIVDLIARYKWEPKDVYEDWEYRYMVSRTVIRRIVDLLGLNEARMLLKEFNRVYPICVRVNLLKSSVEEVLQALRSEGVDPVVGSYVNTVIKFRGPYNFDKSRLLGEGKIVIQDEAAALASIILHPKPGQIVVDMCAAPGGKTEHIGELMRNQGVIYAFDVDEARIRRMRELLSRAGVTIVKIYREDARNAPNILGEGIADRVLLDAPCSSSGTLMKNQELRWRITEESIREATALQYELLRTAIALSKPGGRILYTTCSVFREENEDVVGRILKEFGNSVELVPLNSPFDQGFMSGTMRAWPHKNKTLGFFYALLERRV
ncbi:MAG: RsmB/NOP family class I SAM-dependent RNA methyltransferase [Ignisphaera sp.]|nr:RsmB/NOP family class I SAM-dependent RNA methyltransferase [Ignisphaera sp.]MDW8085711.1 RsmB/NOP family class I SAM-dependent RNA methyltransferase [Ignisphaera sp.]